MYMKLESKIMLITYEDSMGKNCIKQWKVRNDGSYI